MQKLKIIVRLRTQHYMTDTKINTVRTATILKRKSTGSLSDLICDPDVDIPDLTLDEFEDGIYEIITVDHEYDWESGTLDGWRLTLIPYVEANDNGGKL
jgi:hypothetical protein